MTTPTYRELRKRFDFAQGEATNAWAEGNKAFASSFWGRVAEIARELADFCGKEADHEHTR